MSRYSKSDYYNHEGYRDTTVYKALKNIKKGDHKVLKIRIMFDRKNKKELDAAIAKIEEHFKVIDKSSIYNNTKTNVDCARIYIDIENK